MSSIAKRMGQITYISGLKMVIAVLLHIAFLYVDYVVNGQTSNKWSSITYRVGKLNIILYIMLIKNYL